MCLFATITYYNPLNRQQLPTPHCLPTTAHFPSSLNCYVPQCQLLTRGKHFVCTIAREIIKQSDKK